MERKEQWIKMKDDIGPLGLHRGSPPPPRNVEDDRPARCLGGRVPSETSAECEWTNGQKLKAPLPRAKKRPLPLAVIGRAVFLSTRN